MVGVPNPTPDMIDESRVERLTNPGSGARTGTSDDPLSFELVQKIDDQPAFYRLARSNRIVGRVSEACMYQDDRKEMGIAA